MTELFVGRATERAAFRSALRGARDVPPVPYLHAKAGAGKSAQLRQYGDAAARAGRTVLKVDGSRFATPKVLSAAMGNIGGLPDPVLLVDDVDRSEGLAPWLRGCLLPSLSEDAIVVPAGPGPPDRPRLPIPDGPASPARTGSRLWRRASRSCFSTASTCRDRRRPSSWPSRRDTLSLCASPRPTRWPGTAPAAGTAGAWIPTRSTTSFLVGSLAGEVTRVSHHRALAVGAAVGVVTEGLLRAQPAARL